MRKFIEDLLKDTNFFINIASKIGISLVIFFLGRISIKFIKKFVRKILYSDTRIEERKRQTLIKVSDSVSKYIIYFLVICTILTTFGINITSILAVASVGSVAIGFGAQSLVQDIISGLFILIEDQYGVGDIIKVGIFSGTVENITIKTTQLRSADGDLHIIPNGQIKEITNMSKDFNRAIVDVGISYKEDIKKTIDILQKELNDLYKNNKIDYLLCEPIVLGITAFQDNAMNIRISADCIISKNWAVEREIRKYIKITLDRENIEIPYPKRVIKIVKEENF